MSFCLYNMLSCSHSLPLFTNSSKTHYIPSWKFIIFKQPRIYFPVKSSLQQEMVGISEENKEKVFETEEEEAEEKPKYRWIEIGPNVTESQKQAISQIPLKMTKRCSALVKQIICFNPQETVLSSLLTSWVKIMKPQRADWLSVLKEITRLDHPLLFEVTEWALLEESFEPNVRDYTKLIDAYAKKSRLQDAENAFEDMKRRGFTYDLVTLTTLVHMYSKNGNLKRAEETFEDMKLLGLPLDQRAYGSMIMAYIRAGKTELGESLLIEMDAQHICAGREVYKALLRAYSEIGDTKGAQRVFDGIQFAGIAPDARLCALLMNAYLVAGQSTGVRNVFENMRSAGLEPSDKCLALMLSAYEKENKLKMAMDFLMNLERDGIMVGQEASVVLAGWFRRLGVVGDIELVLREYATPKKLKHREPAV